MVKGAAKHLVFSIGLLLMISLVGVAQTSTNRALKGTVTDQQGGAIPRATILAKNDDTGAKFRAAANEVGVWEISSVPKGSYTVTVRAQHFRDTVLKNIRVETAPTATADATMQIGLANDITVTASKYEEEVLNAPATATIIPEITIQYAPTQYVANLLRTVPGMNVAQLSAASFAVASRSASGSVAGTQLALVDGRTIYQDYIGMTLWHMDESLDDIKQIEVIRGPASAIWGSYAMNGVVNIVTKPPREMMGTTLTLGIGTFDRSGGGAKSDTGSLYYARATHAQVLNDHWSFKITGSAYTQDPFARPQGTVPNDFHTPYPPYTNKGTTQPRVDSRVDYDHPDGKQHFMFAGGYGTSSGTYPGAAGGTDVEGGSAYGKVDYLRGSLRIAGYVNTLNWDAKLLVAEGPTGQPILMDHKSATWHFEFGNYRTLAVKHLISYGGSFRHAGFRITHFAPEEMNRNEGGAYLQGDFLISTHLRWVVGTRVDMFDSLKGAVVSPRTTFIVKPAPDQTIRASYNRAYVAPSVYFTNMQLPSSSLLDLGLIDPQLAGNYYRFPFCFCGNEDLKEQSLNAYEVGYSATVANGRASLGAAFYINDSKGEFYWSQAASYTSQNPPPGWMLPPFVLDALIASNAFGPGMGLPSQILSANRGKVRSKGLELNADARFSRYVSGHANYSWQARPESKGFDVFGINHPPRHRFNAGVDFDYGRYLGNASVGYVGSAYWNDVINVLYSGPSKAYTTVSVSGGVRWGENWRYAAMLKIFNLANVQVQNHIYGDIIKRQIAGEFQVRF